MKIEYVKKERIYLKYISKEKYDKLMCKSIKRVKELREEIRELKLDIELHEYDCMECDR